MKIFIEILFFMVASVKPDFGQTWSAISKERADNIFIELGDWFTAHQNYSVKICHKSFTGDSEHDYPHESWNGFLTYSGKNYHSDLLGIQTIQNKEFRIVIDSGNKVIVVSNFQDLDKEIFRLPDSVASSSNIDYSLASTGSRKILRLDFPWGDKLTREEYSYDPQYRLQQVALWFAGSSESEVTSNVKHLVLIEYAHYDLDPVIDFNIEFSEREFLSDSADILSLAPSYSDYRLIDARLKK